MLSMSSHWLLTLLPSQHQLSLLPACPPAFLPAPLQVMAALSDAGLAPPPAQQQGAAAARAGAGMAGAAPLAQAHGGDAGLWAGSAGLQQQQEHHLQQHHLQQQHQQQQQQQQLGQEQEEQQQQQLQLLQQPPPSEPPAELPPAGASDDVLSDLQQAMAALDEAEGEEGGEVEEAAVDQPLGLPELHPPQPHHQHPWASTPGHPYSPPAAAAAMSAAAAALGSDGDCSSSIVSDVFSDSQEPATQLGPGSGSSGEGMHAAAHVSAGWAAGPAGLREASSSGIGIGGGSGGGGSLLQQVAQDIAALSSRNAALQREIDGISAASSSISQPWLAAPASAAAAAAASGPQRPHAWHQQHQHQQSPPAPLPAAPPRLQVATGAGAGGKRMLGSGGHTALLPPTPDLSQC